VIALTSTFPPCALPSLRRPWQRHTFSKTEIIIKNCGQLSSIHFSTRLQAYFEEFPTLVNQTALSLSSDLQTMRGARI
jgi:hypothetical protein